jgi:hypothetical protein
VIRSGGLEEFINQEESRGIGPIDRAEFDCAVAKVIKAKRLEGRTSRSADGGNLNGTKTRRGTDQGASD